MVRTQKKGKHRQMPTFLIGFKGFPSKSSNFKHLHNTWTVVVFLTIDCPHHPHPHMSWCHVASQIRTIPGPCLLRIMDAHSGHVRDVLPEVPHLVQYIVRPSQASRNMFLCTINQKDAIVITGQSMTIKALKPVALANYESFMNRFEFNCAWPKQIYIYMCVCVHIEIRTLREIHGGWIMPVFATLPLGASAEITSSTRVAKSICSWMLRKICYY